MDFSDWLLDQLSKLGWSQSDLARAAGLNRQSISDYVNRRRTNPDPRALISVARALKLPTEVVFRAAGILPQVGETDEFMDQAEFYFKIYKYPKTKERALEFLEYLRVEEIKGEYRVKTARRTTISEPG